MTGEPPSAAGVQAVRVRCDVPPTTLGPLHDARRKIEQLLGGDAPFFDQARDRMVQGLRRRLLGDVSSLEHEGALVEAYNRLARSSSRPAALVFEAVDAADDMVHGALRRILGRPGWLVLPLVLVFRTSEPAGGAAGLLDALRAVAGDEGVLRVEASAQPAFAFRSLPPEVLRVLRAGALVGSGFEADLCASLLGTMPLDVMDALQRAADAGVPVEDLGEGRFHLPDALLDDLRASMLPSLMIAWHQRLADLLGGIDEPMALRSDLEEPEEESSNTLATPLPIPVIQRPRPSDTDHEDGFVPTRRAMQRTVPCAPLTTRTAWSALDADPPPTARGSMGPMSPEHVQGYASPLPTVATGASWRADDVWAPARVAVFDNTALSLRPRALGPSRRPPATTRGDDIRAAGHLAAAGDFDGSAERFIAATRRAIEVGAHAQALTCADKALSLLEGLPSTPRRRLLRARAQTDLGRLRWYAASAATSGPGLTLDGALDALQAARASLDEDAPPELKAEVATLVAGVCYDAGEVGTLNHALDELTTASRLLSAAGDTSGAARLLNDQAAVHVRLGDPLQATRLLEEARRAFEAHAATDPAAAADLAETLHLLARIPLHVPARPGRESDALCMGLSHAHAAERLYHKLSAKRELARVWETMGRLELRMERLERAQERLVAAIETAEAVGDVVGMARGAAAMSELLTAGGRPMDALAVLSGSMARNLEKGSSIGLSLNRRALATLAKDAVPSPEVTAALAEAKARIDAAEAMLGKPRLPAEDPCEEQPPT